MMLAIQADIDARWTNNVFFMPCTPSTISACIDLRQGTYAVRAHCYLWLAPLIVVPTGLQWAGTTLLHPL